MTSTWYAVKDASGETVALFPFMSAAICWGPTLCPGQAAHMEPVDVAVSPDPTRPDLKITGPDPRPPIQTPPLFRPERVHAVNGARPLHPDLARLRGIGRQLLEEPEVLAALLVVWRDDPDTSAFFHELCLGVVERAAERVARTQPNPKETR